VTTKQRLIEHQSAVWLLVLKDPARPPIGKAHDGDGLGVDMLSAEWNHIAGAIDRIEVEDSQVAIVFAARPESQRIGPAPGRLDTNV
jgi:hypothetical protein